jgi:hypothetical protein
MTKEDAIESYKKSVELCKARLDVEKMRMDIGEIKELEFYIERDEMAIQALSQESSDYTGNEFFNFDAPMVKKSADIIKCRDCKHFEKWRCPEAAEKHGQIYSCALLVISGPSPEDYCSRAKRKEEEDARFVAEGGKINETNSRTIF